MFEQIVLVTLYCLTVRVIVLLLEILRHFLFLNDRVLEKVWELSFSDHHELSGLQSFLCDLGLGRFQGGNWGTPQ